MKIIEDKIKNYPTGFAPDDVKRWIEDIPVINNFREIENIFLQLKDANEYFAFKIILRQRYINPALMNAEFYTSKSLHNSENEKLVLFCNRICEEVTINNDSLELFSITNSPKLHTINIKKNSLKYLEIIKCNKLIDFQCIKKLHNVMILNLSDNKYLPELDFLPDNVVILQLIKTNAMKLPNTIHHLKKLKKLKYLNIQAGKKEMELLKIALPNCIIN